MKEQYRLDFKMMQEIIEKEQRADEDHALFMALLCMLAEEYCRDNNLDVVEMLKEMHQTSVSVNEALGKY